MNDRILIQFFYEWLIISFINIYFLDMNNSFKRKTFLFTGNIRNKFNLNTKS